LSGALIWGYFPDFFPGKNISWEIHTTGALAGIIAAFYFKKDGPQRPDPFAEEEDREEDEDDNDENAYWKIPDTKNNT
jgi:hypothetical protein